MIGSSASTALGLARLDPTYISVGCGREVEAKIVELVGWVDARERGRKPIAKRGDSE